MWGPAALAASDRVLRTMAARRKAKAQRAPIKAKRAADASKQ